MDFANQADRNREFRQPVEAAAHSADVVHHFVHVAGPVRREDIRFGRQQVVQRTLRALDLAREHRFLANVHVYEQVRMGKRLNGPVQPSQGKVGLREQSLQRSGERDRRVGRERRRNKGPVAGRLKDVSACPRRRCGMIRRHDKGSLLYDSPPEAIVKAVFIMGRVRGCVKGSRYQRPPRVSRPGPRRAAPQFPRRRSSVSDSDPGAGREQRRNKGPVASRLKDVSACPRRWRGMIRRHDKGSLLYGPPPESIVKAVFIMGRVHGCVKGSRYQRPLAVV